jgi:hypothetical protein
MVFVFNWMNGVDANCYQNNKDDIDNENKRLLSQALKGGGAAFLASSLASATFLTGILLSEASAVGLIAFVSACPFVIIGVTCIGGYLTSRNVIKEIRSNDAERIISQAVEEQLL